MKLSKQMFEPIKGDFIQQVGGKEQIFRREISFAMQICKKNTRLMGKNVDPNSLLSAVFNVSLIGLTLNPASKECYLVPRYNKLSKLQEIHLEPSYIGLTTLLVRAGSVSHIVAHNVYEGCKYACDLGMNEISHVAWYNTNKERGKYRLTYAVAHLNNGSKIIEEMTFEDIEDIKMRSESYRAFSANKITSCVWVEHEDEMRRKTVIRRLSKYCPRTEKMAQYDFAVSLDNSDFEATDSQVQYILDLMRSSSLDENRKEDIVLQLQGISSKDASVLIEELQENQLNPVTEAPVGEYQTGINKRLDQVVDDPKK